MIVRVEQVSEPSSKSLNTTFHGQTDWVHMQETQDHRYPTEKWTPNKDPHTHCPGTVGNIIQDVPHPNYRLRSLLPSGRWGPIWEPPLHYTGL